MLAIYGVWTMVQQLPPTSTMLQPLLQYISRWRKQMAARMKLAQRSNATTALPLPARYTVLNAQELQQAETHHLTWCKLFNDHLSADEKKAQQLPPLPMADDSDLGRWLRAMHQGIARGDPRFDALIKENTRFHHLAQEALALVRQGHIDLASTLLNTDFERSRSRVQSQLKQLQKTSA